MTREICELGWGRRAAVSFAFMAGCFAPVAVAQLKPEHDRPATQQEARAALLGIDMDGYSPSAKMNWRECIDPFGVTLYETPDGVRNGLLEVMEDGRACFAYEDDDYTEWGCFNVRLTGKGLVFDNEFGDVFVTTSLTTGVRSCKAELIG